MLNNLVLELCSCSCVLKNDQLLATKDKADNSRHIGVNRLCLSLCGLLGRCLRTDRPYGSRFFYGQNGWTRAEQMFLLPFLCPWKRPTFNTPRIGSRGTHPIGWVLFGLTLSWHAIGVPRTEVKTETFTCSFGTPRRYGIQKESSSGSFIVFRLWRPRLRSWRRLFCFKQISQWKNLSRLDKRAHRQKFCQTIQQSLWNRFLKRHSSLRTKILESFFRF